MSLLNAGGRQGVRTMSSLCRRLQGKVAVVTASTDGIGYSIAERLLDEGASVVVSSRKADNVAKAVERLTPRGRVAGVVCHVGKRDDRVALLKTAEEKFGGIDILVSNAAVNPSVGGVTETSDEAWDKIFDINVKSAFTLTKEVKPYLSRRGGGSIVYVSSIAGFVPQQLLGAYSVSKTALLGLTKACAEELATENVRVNCVAPGIIKTNFSSALHTSEMVSEPLLMTVAMHRFGRCEEVAGVVAFLVSEDASYVTGETVVCSGGMPSRL
uniref:Dehydrogenase/reductase SDR family member 4 n=4 Tax=Lygus hesperus TaxID=30085 RepID=A0A0K8SGQ3_LYGHE